MKYTLKIKKEAHQDIQEGIKWYNSKQKGLGQKFHVAIKKEYEVICKNPYFQIRYKNVRCLPIKKYPYMLHYIVNEEKKEIILLGVTNTYKSPENWISRV